MIKALVSDFSRVIIFPKQDDYRGGLNLLHKISFQKPGYSALQQFRLNHELLKYYQSLKRQCILAIFTSGTVQDSPEFRQHLDPVFQRVFSAPKLGLEKADPKAYEKIAGLLGVRPAEILFVDDSDTNIAAARIAGCQTITYQNNDDLFQKLQDALGVGRE